MAIHAQRVARHKPTTRQIGVTAIAIATSQMQATRVACHTRAGLITITQGSGSDGIESIKIDYNRSPCNALPTHLRLVKAKGLHD